MIFLEKYYKSILIWLLYFVLLVALFNYKTGKLPLVFFSWFVHFAIVYLNIKILIPKLFLKGKYVLYFFLILFLIIGFLIIFQELTRYSSKKSTLLEAILNNNLSLKKILSFITNRPSIITILIFIISSFIYVYDENIKAKEKNLTLVNLNMTNELRFLKSQINPHFLFNTLNNIYSIILQDSEKGANSVVKLSEMLRFILYDLEKEKINISDEITYIENYISLQSLKDDSIISNLIFNHYIEVDNKIEPMLFLPFIENSFKHSNIGLSHNSSIVITIRSDKNNVFFSIKNTFDKKSIYKRSKLGGIGNENVKKRLDILYPSCHTLIINHCRNEYEVKITLYLKNV